MHFKHLYLLREGRGLPKSIIANIITSEWTVRKWVLMIPVFTLTSSSIYTHPISAAKIWPENAPRIFLFTLMHTSSSIVAHWDQKLKKVSFIKRNRSCPIINSCWTWNVQAEKCSVCRRSSLMTLFPVPIINDGNFVRILSCCRYLIIWPWDKIDGYGPVCIDAGGVGTKEEKGLSGMDDEAKHEKGSRQHF